MSETKSAIVVGASSGIGEALAHEFAANGYEAGRTAWRTVVLTVFTVVVLRCSPGWRCSSTEDGWPTAPCSCSGACCSGI